MLICWQVNKSQYMVVGSRGIKVQLMYQKQEKSFRTTHFRLNMIYVLL